MESDSFNFTFEGFDDLKFVSYSLNSDNSTTITVDKAKISGPSSNKVKITVNDFEGSIKKEIMIRVTYFDARIKPFVPDPITKPPPPPPNPYAYMTEPKMTINPISPEGKISISFDQDMQFPSTIIQSAYKSVFVCSITSV